MPVQDPPKSGAPEDITLALSAIKEIRSTRTD
jgi:hypothetical protein